MKTNIEIKNSLNAYLNAKKQEPAPQNEYEDVRVFKKRTKKKNREFKEDNASAVTQINYHEKVDQNDKIPDNIHEQNEIDDVRKDQSIYNSQCSENKTRLSRNFPKKPNTDEKPITTDEKPSSDKKPFESFQNCLFSLFTSCVPWSCMRRIYWRRDRRDEYFPNSSRSRSTKKRR